MEQAKEFHAVIEHITSYSEDLKLFRLRLPENSSFSFVPGQFVMVSLPGLLDRNGRRIARAYSIASPPSETSFVELCMVRHPGGAFSPVMFKAKASDEVIVAGPYGTFAGKSAISEGSVLIAGGTGIAPLMCMLRSYYSAGGAARLWLFYSMSTPEEFAFKDELLGYAKSNSLRLVVSTSNPNSGWQWDKGRVTATFPNRMGELNGIPKESRKFFICGPPEMVSDTVRMLLELGFRKENIHKEQW
ncbi:hypothetical protein HYU17_01250 [Candidatus Woesearchaeota archaeon]|nr:hypothetical protein [Candidatus Woesearchaeota archaeon]